MTEPELPDDRDESGDLDWGSDEEPVDVDQIEGDTAGVPPQDRGLADPGALGATEEPDAEDAMLDSWADDADALGTEAGGFGPDRPRDARMPGIYSSDEIDDVATPGDVHDDDFTGQGEPE